MHLAIEEARRAAERNEIPVGAIAICGDRVLASDGNRREQLADPSAHAEIQVMRRAAAIRGHWNLHDVEIYVTLEPCPMCLGALIAARVPRVVYGAADPRHGGQSLYMMAGDQRLFHQVDLRGGILADQCARILRDFFATRRDVR